MSEKGPEMRLAQGESSSNGVPPIPSPMPGYDLKEQIRRRKEKVKKHEESLVSAFCTWVVDHQIGIAMNLLLLLTLTHLCFPRARPHTRKFFTLSYYNSESGRYGVGWDDAWFMMLWIVIFTGLRIFVMDYIMAPFADMAGIHKKKDKTRFAEQAWIYVYPCVFWSLGMYIMYNSKYWLALEYIWADWPDREMDKLVKWYYLVQFAFWLQQIVVVNIEERRKDYSQMFTHHVVTSALLFTSYGYHHYRIGNVIMCLMDAVDMILPLAKILKYLKFQKACDVAFGAFVVVWLVTRHLLYALVVYSIYRDLPNHIQFGCYKGPPGKIEGPFPPPNSWEYLIAPFKDPDGLVCQTQAMQNMFVGMLLFLQCILLLWFGMIVRVVIKVLSGHSAEDVRSDDEDEEDIEQQENLMKDVCIQGNYIEVPSEDVSVEMLSRASGKSSPANRFRRANGNASGVSIPHDRKELLGRIGCDKQN